MSRIFRALSAVLPVVLWTAPLRSQVLDDFETGSEWVVAPADGVSLTVTRDSGRSGQALRLDFDFQGHGGYAVVRRRMPIPLPENYAFTFWIRGQAPLNNLEFKLVDSTGDNVWWRNQRGFEFPTEWRKITIRKRQIEFAWGPRGGGEAGGIAAIEFAVTAGTGGKGTVWIDELRLEPRPPERPYTRTPGLSASSSAAGHQVALAGDADTTTFWRSASAGRQWVAFDFLQLRELGGLTILWMPGLHAPEYVVETSEEGRQWVPAYRAAGSNGGRDYIYLPETETRFLRISCLEGKSGYAIRSVVVHPLEWSASRNRFFRAIARESPRGSYPRYFEDVQTYWTMIGINGDGRRSLLSQFGSFEPVAGGFSVEPFLHADGRLITWADVQTDVSLQDGYLPVPSVEWKSPGLDLRITAFAAGGRRTGSAYTWYHLTNSGSGPRRGTLYLALRPFQVNPPWQFLGVPGGFAGVSQLAQSGNLISVNGRARVETSTVPSRFGASTFDQGDVTEYLVSGEVPSRQQVTDEFGAASGVAAFDFELAPGASRDVVLRFALGDSLVADPAWRAQPTAPMAPLLSEWKSLLGRVVIDLPPEAQPIEDAIKTSLAYILINRDSAAIEPGARSYRRSWIRDGAMIGSALLRMGQPEAVREFIEWYAPFQYESGKVPCCVDFRGADPVAEHDSHGELIHIIAEYYRYTGDQPFLHGKWKHVMAAARFIDSLRATRRTAEYRSGQNQKYFGLMPPSISHEGYSAKPVHSYWDDFWTLRGLNDAAELAEIAGSREERAFLSRISAEFRDDLHQSLRRTITEAGIQYIPGSADLADYDPTSTSIGLEPGGQASALPPEALRHTFDRYLREVRARADSTGWDAYTPYEWRNVGAFVRLNEPAKALELLNILFTGRRPAAWNQWPEVIHRDSLAPQFLGDLPHTWVGSDFIRSVLDLFAYVRLPDSTLVLAAGLPARWIEEEPGVTVAGFPIGKGRLSMRLTATGARLEGDLAIPPGGILLHRPGKVSEVHRVTRLPAEIGWQP